MATDISSKSSDISISSQKPRFINVIQEQESANGQKGLISISNRVIKQKPKLKIKPIRKIDLKGRINHEKLQEAIKKMKSNEWLKFKPGFILSKDSREDEPMTPIFWKSWDDFQENINPQVRASFDTYELTFNSKQGVNFLSP